MTSSNTTIILLIVMFISMVLGFLAISGANMPRKDRANQFIMPIFAAVFCLAVMPFVKSLTSTAMGLVGLIGRILSGLSDVSFLPLSVQNMLNNGGGFIQDTALANNQYTSFIYLNLLILAVYLIVKLILIKGILRAFSKDPLAMETVKGLCYEYSLDQGGWFLKERMLQARDLLKVLFWFTVVFTAILLIVSTYLFRMNVTQTLFYPIFSLILVSELYFYLGGLSLPEFKHDVLGEDEEVTKKANYSILRAQLKRLFGDKLLADDVESTYTVAEDTTMEDVIHQFEMDEDPVVNNLAKYIRTIEKGGMLDTNYLYSMRDLLDGKSILFNNPFYRDLIPYVFYPMNRRLLAHKKVLVVLGRHAAEEDAKKWLEDGIGAVTNLPYLWKIDMLDQKAKDVDIGIMTRSDVYDIEIHEANQNFLSEVDFVVLLEPSKMISTAQIGLNLLVKKIHSDEEKTVTYCLCDKNCDGLVDAMSHILMTNITEVSATRKHGGTSSFMCWEADDEYLHHRMIPNISRYLGVGTELSFVALKNGISTARWYGGETFPVTDIRWIAKQYYHDLMNYAELPTNQDYMNEHFETSSNLWSAEINEFNYITVEDECFNMFEMFREFSTRASKQSLINIISADYLLKDYMADNAGIFRTDAKAIPNIVADYIRSDRNVTLRLLLMMSTYPISEEVIRNELSLLGIGIFDLKKQLWYEIFKCFASVSEISTLSKDYREAVEQVSERELQSSFHTFSSQILVENIDYNFFKGKEERVYSVTDRDFLDSCIRSLRSAAYIAEDERGEKNYLGSELYDHIYSKYLPGQFFSFAGKYYEMQYLTADGQVLVRRAADHISGRPSYRQIREYSVEGMIPSTMIGSTRDVDGFRVSRQFADLSVNTIGYFRMSGYNNFKTAKKVAFEGEGNRLPKKEYKNKEILVIDLPQQEALTDKVRYTITLLLNEVFRTIFADNQPFISAVTDCSFLGEDYGSKPLTYTLAQPSPEEAPGRIYIIEDSQLDLGMINTVDRNLQRIMGIICDYLDWHQTMMGKTGSEEDQEEPPKVIFVEGEIAGDRPKRKGIGGLIDKIFGGKKRKGGVEMPAAPVPAPAPAQAPVDLPDLPDAEIIPEGAELTDLEDLPDLPDAEVVADAPELPDTADLEDLPEAEATDDAPVTDDAPEQETAEGPEEAVEAEGTEEPEETVEATEIVEPEEPADAAEAEAEETGEQPEDEAASGPEKLFNVSNPEITVEPEEAKAEAEPPVHAVSFEGDGAKVVKEPNQGHLTGKRKPYRDRHYMLFGTGTLPAGIDMGSTHTYLQQNGFENNALKQARDGRNKAEEIEKNYMPNKPGVRYCDFCGAELTGVEYETLKDGRDRCISCSRTSVKTAEEFREIFDDVRRNMREFFGVNINVGIKVEMVNARKLHKKIGKPFIPTASMDSRVVGVAIQDRNGFTLLIENGAPRMKTILTMAHELTHIWQYLNWDAKQIKAKYGPLELQVYEGMATWASIQYAYLLGEIVVGKREELQESFRNDVYGQGLLRYMANYPLSEGTELFGSTPFANIDTPLAPEFCQGVPVPNVE